MTTNDNAHQPLIEALQAIVHHYANPNLSHQDYRVKACQQAEHALTVYRGAQLDGWMPDWWYELIYAFQAREIHAAKLAAQGTPAQRLADLERVCAGLSQELIDGGWTTQGIRRHCRQVERDRTELFQVSRDALCLLRDLVGQLDWARGTPALDAIDAFLDLHVETLLRIAANVSPVARQESV